MNEYQKVLTIYRHEEINQLIEKSRRVGKGARFDKREIGGWNYYGNAYANTKGNDSPINKQKHGCWDELEAVLS